MALDILGPASAANTTTVRPSDTRIFGVADTFFKPCSSPSALDGTQLQAVFLNGVLQQLRRAIRGMGITENNLDDDMLLKAIQAAGAGALLFAEAAANMPIHVMVGTAGLLNVSVGTGSIVVSTGQNITHRGIRSYDLSNLSLANRTFATAVSKTYHLRWYAPGTGRATPASSWPAGRLYLEDLADVGYNATALAETNKAFDSTYDSVLLQRVVTNGSNVLTVTSLNNQPVLSAELSSFFDHNTPGQFVQGVDMSLLCNHAVTINWGRTPRIAVPTGWIGINASSVVNYMNSVANIISIGPPTRYQQIAYVLSDWVDLGSISNYYSQLLIKAVA